MKLLLVEGQLHRQTSRPWTQAQCQTTHWQKTFQTFRSNGLPYVHICKQSNSKTSDDTLPGTFVQVMAILSRRQGVLLGRGPFNKAVARISQSKARRDKGIWHDVALPSDLYQPIPCQDQPSPPSQTTFLALPRPNTLAEHAANIKPRRIIK